MSNMAIVPRWLFCLFYISALALVLICSAAIVKEISREPVSNECVLAPVDEKEWDRQIEAEQEELLKEWDHLSHEEVALELDRRYKNHLIAYFSNEHKSSGALAEAAFVYRQWGLTMLAACGSWLIFWSGFLIIYEFLRKRSADFLELQQKGKISEASFWRRWKLWDTRKSLVPQWFYCTAIVGMLVPIYYLHELTPMFSVQMGTYISKERELKILPSTEKIQTNLDRNQEKRLKKIQERTREEMIRRYFKVEKTMRKSVDIDPQLEHRQLLLSYQASFSRLFVYLYTGMIIWVVFHLWLLWKINRKVSRKVAGLTVSS